MEKTFQSNPNEVTQTKIAFRFYVISIPIVAFLFLLPYILGSAIRFSPLHLAYVAVIVFVGYGAFRARQVMHAVRASECVVTDTSVEGVNTPDPHRSGERFSINRSEIKSVGRKQIPLSTARSLNAVVINTEHKQYVLLALENEDELIHLLRSEI